MYIYTYLIERLGGVDIDNSLMDNLRDEEEEDSLYLQTAVNLLLQAAEEGFIAAKTDLGILFELAMDPEKAIRYVHICIYIYTYIHIHIKN
jgi:hypothetical protein